VALQALPAAPSEDRVRLHLGLALSMLLGRDFVGALAHAADARDDARALADPVVEAAALSCAAAAATALRSGDTAPADEGAAAFSALTDAQAVVRVPGLWMLARANRALGRFAVGLEHLERGERLARASGRPAVLLVLRAEAAGLLVELGRVEAALAAAEEATELARLLGSPPMHVWAHSALSAARLAAGDATGALARPMRQRKTVRGPTSRPAASPAGRAATRSWPAAMRPRARRRSGPRSAARGSRPFRRASAPPPTPTSWRRGKLPHRLARRTPSAAP
jgi:tetratricopeptide (TPR) repeat protein